MRLRLVLALLVAAPVAARAQAADSALAYQNIAGVDIIGLPFGLVSGEFEHVVSPGFVIGVGGTYSNVVGLARSDVQTSGLDVKAKYYPSEESFKGFSVGLTAGFVNMRGDNDSPDYFTGTGSNYQSKSAPTVGVVLDYNWLLGRRQKLYVGTGIGAKRVFGTTGASSVLDPVVPYGRLQVGIAF